MGSNLDADNYAVRHVEHFKRIVPELHSNSVVLHHRDVLGPFKGYRYARHSRRIDIVECVEPQLHRCIEHLRELDDGVGDILLSQNLRLGSEDAGANLH